MCVFRVRNAFLFICLFICVLYTDLQSRHIIGSDFYYSCTGAVSGNSTRVYSLNLTIYRDCSNPSGSGYDPDATFGIYRYSNNRYTYVRQFLVNHGPINRVRPDNNPCLIIPPNVCVEESSYNFNVELPLTDETYVIYYMRCCRNNTILNLIAPNNTGATFYIEITPEAQLNCNNSPRFKSFPPIVVCADFPLTFDHSAIDSEGDSLVYGFCTPLAGGGSGQGDPFGGSGCAAVRPDPRICSPPFQYVSFVSPLYTTEDPMGPGVLSLDRITGKLEGMPRELGQYVMGICVFEYRNGKLIGEIHRDFQFNVGICEQAVEAKIKADTSMGKTFTLNHCGDRNVSLFNESFRAEYIKTYFWEFTSKARPGSAAITSNDKDPTITFPEPGEYEGIMIVNKNALVCSDTAYVKLNIIPSDINADFDFTYDKCSSSAIQFTDKSTGVLTPIKKWTWDFKDGNQSSLKSPAHLFKKPGNYAIKLTVTDGKICKSEKIKDLNYFPSPTILDVLPNRFRACVPADIHFENLSIPLDSNYIVEWDFGDGNKANTQNANHVYTKPGSYSISMSIKAPSGCVTKESFPNFVIVQDGPEADFDFEPKELTLLNPIVRFTNLAREALNVTWNFGDNLASSEKNPIHKYLDTGRYIITQIARHENGCIDTISKLIRVGLNISYFLPNAFTPNNDGINDIYIGTGSTIGMRDFSMKIFNRWGEQIYYSEDPRAGWNGRKNNKGNLEANGVYVCVVKYKTDKDEVKELKSFATLIR